MSGDSALKTENNQVRIIVEMVFQPPIDTRCTILHKSVVVESAELAELLAGGCGRVIAGVLEKEP